MYPLWGQLWPIAGLLLLMCTPRRIRGWLGRWLTGAGFTIGLLLALPFLISLFTG